MKKEDVKVSIVVPCYNVENYVAECLDSLCTQTYQNLQIICVDDGSTDKTTDIISQYQEKDERISLIRQANQYAGRARNYGLEKADGRYVCFLDADDFFRTDMIEKMVGVAERYDTDIVLCNARFYNDVTKEISEPSHILSTRYLTHAGKVFCYRDIPERILAVGGVVPWNKLYRIDFIKEKKLAFQETRRCNDEYFVGMSMVLARKISYIDERFVTYRMNNNNSLQGYAGTEVSFDFFKALYALRQGLAREGLLEEVQKNYVNKALQGCRVALERQKDVQKFVEIYHFLKTEAFEKLGIQNLSREDIYAGSEWYEKVMKYDALGYLFYSLKEMQENKGEKFLFPYKQIGDCRRIALYGFGEVGHAFYRQLDRSTYYQIVGCFDANYKKLRADGTAVIDPEKVHEYQFDKIVVAVNEEMLYREIEKFLLAHGVEREKIVWGCRKS